MGRHLGKYGPLYLAVVGFTAAFLYFFGGSIPLNAQSTPEGKTTFDVFVPADFVLVTEDGREIVCEFDSLNEDWQQDCQMENNPDINFGFWELSAEDSEEGYEGYQVSFIREVENEGNKQLVSWEIFTIKKKPGELFAHVESHLPLKSRKD